MKTLYRINFLILTLVCSVFINAKTNKETKNPFLEKAYWESLPSIASIDENITKGYSITKANKYGFDPVTYAIFGHNPITTIDYLLSKGNDVNKLTHDFRTYVFWAAYKGNLELMKHLVSKGAKMDLKDSHGYSVLNFSAATGQDNIALYDFCIAQGADLLNDKDHDGRTALLIAASKLKDLKLIDYFIEKGLDINSKDNNGNGIFIHAAKGGNVTVLKALVERGVSTKMNEKTGENAMFFATKGGRGIQINKDAFIYLENLGISPNIVTKKGKTPLHNLAKSSEDTELFDYFIEKGVSVNAVDEEGNTVLINASRRNNLEVITYLIGKTKDINHANKKGYTALTMAVKNNSAEVVEYMLSKNASVTVLDNKGNTLAKALIDSFSEEDLASFDAKKKALINSGLNLKQFQGGKSTLYHLAIEKNSIDLLKKIENIGIDINAIDAKGNTALHYAAMKNDNAEVLNFLIKKGADKNIKTTFGESAYDLAKENELLNGVTVGFLK